MDWHLKEVFGLFQQQFGLGPGNGPSSGTSLLKVDALSTGFIKAIFGALAVLWRSNPWKRLKPSHLLGIKVDKDSDWPDARQPFVVAQLIDHGIYFFRSEADARGMMGIHGLGNTKSIPLKGLLRVTYGLEAELSPVNRKMIKTLGLEIAGAKAYPVIDVVYSPKDIADGFPSFRNPTVEELHWFYAALRALTQIHPLLQQVDGVQGGAMFKDLTKNLEISWPSEDTGLQGNATVRVTFPPKDEHEEQVNPPPKLVEVVSENRNTAELESKVPRQCTLCGIEVPADRAPRCSRCKAVIYCSHACQKKHWKETHKVSCELYKAMMEREEELEIKGFSFVCVMEHSCNWLESMGLHGKGMWRRLCTCFKQYPFGLLPPVEGGSMARVWAVEHGKYPPDSPLQEYLVLSSWAEYYDLRGLPADSPVALILSFPLSLYSIVTSLCVPTKTMLSKGREVIVHYLGPEGELDWLPAFSEIGYLLGGSGSLHVMMIGPEVPIALAGGMTAVNPKLRVTFIRGLYQEEANALPTPHVVVALNSQLEAHSSWAGALEVIKAQAVPAFFTDYAEPCCVNAKQMLRATGLQITHPVSANPFRSPVRNQIADTNLPWYSNGFVFGVNT